MDLQSIYVSNGTGVFILVILLYTSRTKFQRHRTEDLLYTLMVFGVMLGCCMEALSYTIDGQVFAGSRIINYLANTYLFTANMLMALFLLLYVDLGLYGDKNRIWGKYKAHIVIAAIMIALNVVNFFVPIVYWISDQNVYERRPLSYAYLVVILAYFASAYVVSRSFERKYGAKTFFRIELFLAPVLLGTVLQFMFYGLSLAWMASAVGLVGLYMMQQNEMAYIDSLTDVYNRRYLNDIMAGWINQEITFTGAMLDIDRFKEINDAYGHTEGDKVLKDVADVLMRSRADGEWVFRFAGDEFIILKRDDAADALDAYMDRVAENLKAYNNAGNPYALELSYGLSQFSAGDVNSFMKELDDRMYEMKAEHHKGS